ncbi:hypothetical protein SynA1560_01049 [Synechococcus sp. A15-60]|nr:hypothetical protein SynA1560_01049 [Synechococcus sp. A15-60]
MSSSLPQTTGQGTAQFAPSSCDPYAAPVPDIGRGTGSGACGSGRGLGHRSELGHA